MERGRVEREKGGRERGGVRKREETGRERGGGREREGKRALFNV